MKPHYAEAFVLRLQSPDDRIPPLDVVQISYRDDRYLYPINPPERERDTWWILEEATPPPWIDKLHTQRVFHQRFGRYVLACRQKEYEAMRLLHELAHEDR